MSDKTRAERKATTKAAAKTGELKPAGEAAEVKDDKPSRDRLGHHPRRAQGEDQGRQQVGRDPEPPAKRAARKAPKKP